MSFERIWKWKCDEPGCDAEKTFQKFGLPRGWVWVKSKEAGGRFTHRCRDHATDAHRKAMDKFNAESLLGAPVFVDDDTDAPEADEG